MELTQLGKLSDKKWYFGSFCLAPGGKTLASISIDKSIVLWDVASRQELHTLQGHADFVSSLAFATDGKTLASGSRDGTIKLWDVARGAQLQNLRRHRDDVTSIAFSADGRTMVSGSWDKTIKIWNGPRWTEKRTLSHGSLPIRKVAFSPNGTNFASANNSNAIELWDSSRGSELRTMVEHTNIVNTVVFSPDGQILASGSSDKNILLWNMGNGTVLHTLRGHHDRVNSISFSPDGRMLASGSDDETVKLWDVTSGTLIKTSGREAAVSVVAFAPDNKIFSCSASGFIWLWAITPKNEIASPPATSNGSLEMNQDEKQQYERLFELTLEDVQRLGVIIEKYAEEHYVLRNEQTSFRRDGFILGYGSILDPSLTIDCWPVENNEGKYLLKLVNYKKAPKTDTFFMTLTTIIDWMVANAKKG